MHASTVARVKGYQAAAGGGATGEALVRGGVGKLIFIGSTGVGRAVMRAAADTLTPVTLELGGKDPFVVCGDANVSEVVPTALRAAFQSCGQNCVAAERFIVHEAVYDDFLARCAAITKDLRQGDPLGGFAHLHACRPPAPALCATTADMRGQLLAAAGHVRYSVHSRVNTA